MSGRPLSYGKIVAGLGRLISWLLLPLLLMMAAVTLSSPARALTEQNGTAELETRLREIQDELAGLMTARIVDVAPEGLEAWLVDAGSVSVAALCLVAALGAAIALAYSRFGALLAAVVGTYVGVLFFAIATSGPDTIQVFPNSDAVFAFAAGYLLLSAVLPSVLLALLAVVVLDREARQWLIQGGQVSVDDLPEPLRATIQAYKTILPPRARRRLERRGMISRLMLEALEAQVRGDVQRSTQRLKAETENLNRLQAIDEVKLRRQVLEGVSGAERAVMEVKNQAQATIKQLEARIRELQAENRRLCR